MRKMTCLVALTLNLALAAGCRGGNVGEACGTPGRSDDCVEGAVCVTDPPTDREAEPNDPVWDTYSCRIECDHQNDCSPGEECRGVSGASGIRACQPPRTL